MQMNDRIYYHRHLEHRDAQFYKYSFIPLMKSIDD